MSTRKMNNMSDLDGEPIDSIHMMATTAHHLLGDISSEEPDLCIITREDEDNYYGMWVYGLGYFNVRFPKETTKRLTPAEREHYNKSHLQMNSTYLGQLRIKGYEEDE